MRGTGIKVYTQYTLVPQMTTKLSIHGRTCPAKIQNNSFDARVQKESTSRRVGERAKRGYVLRICSVVNASLSRAAAVGTAQVKDYTQHLPPE